MINKNNEYKKFPFVLVQKLQNSTSQSNFTKWEHKKFFDLSLEKFEKKYLTFSPEESLAFIDVCNRLFQVNVISNQELLYNYCKGDFFIFMNILLQKASRNSDPLDPKFFIKYDIDEKVRKIDSAKLEKKSIVCCFLGISNIPLDLELLFSLGVDNYILRTLEDIGIIYKIDHFHTRHELWSIEYLLDFIRRLEDNVDLFEKQYDIESIITSLLTKNDFQIFSRSKMLVFS